MLQWENITIFLFFIFFIINNVIECSIGENFPSYRFCREECEIDNCIRNEKSSYLSNSQRKWYISLTWSCDDNCAYECMWPMVYKCMRNGWQIPQFNGKWPFVRWLGLQEPASAIFSLFNLVVTAYMYKMFYKSVKTKSTMFWIWSFHAIMSINAWFWSFLFHSRDVRFTEFMDYVSASALIYYTVYTFGYRIIIFQNLFFKLLFTGFVMFLFSRTIFYLFMTKFDYRLFKHSLLFIGMIMGVVTLLWCFWNWKIFLHVKYAIIYLTSLMLFSFLEIFDFAPILWIFDAHSLWHFSTIPLPYFMYKFAIEDCRHLRRMTNLSNTFTTVNREL